MDDCLACPICANKLKNIKFCNKFFSPPLSNSNYIIRTCHAGMNHSLQFYFNDDSKLIDFLKISLSPNYSKYIEIDFLNKKSRINCYKNGKHEYISIPKMIKPDFPALTKLKEKVAMLITFS